MVEVDHIQDSVTSIDQHLVINGEQPLQTVELIEMLETELSDICCPNHTLKSKVTIERHATHDWHYDVTACCEIMYSKILGKLGDMDHHYLQLRNSIVAGKKIT